MLLELDHECGAVVPVRAHLGREVAAVERGLDQTSFFSSMPVAYSDQGY